MMGVPSWTTATPADNSWAVSEPRDRQDADRASLLVCGAVDRFRLPPPFRSLCEFQEARAATVHCGGPVGVGLGRGVHGSGRALPAPHTGNVPGTLARVLKDCARYITSDSAHRERTG